jgi:anti-sigma factor ChrR (cupin superfamily)
MNPDDDEITAAEFCLGTLDGAERRRLNDAMNRDPALDRLVQSWERRLAPLGDALAPAQPPGDLWAKIESRIASAGLPGPVTVRATEGEWQPMADGVECKVLWQNAALGRQSLLVRITPGATYESHYHTQDEECVVLAGDLSFGSHLLNAGDYHLAQKGGTHPPCSSKAGCLLYINTAL